MVIATSYTTVTADEALKKAVILINDEIKRIAMRVEKVEINSLTYTDNEIRWFTVNLIAYGSVPAFINTTATINEST